MATNSATSVLENTKIANAQEKKKHAELLNNSKEKHAKLLKIGKLTDF